MKLPPEVLDAANDGRAVTVTIVGTLNKDAVMIARRRSLSTDESVGPLDETGFSCLPVTLRSLFGSVILYVLPSPIVARKTEPQSTRQLVGLDT